MILQFYLQSLPKKNSFVSDIYSVHAQLVESHVEGFVLVGAMMWRRLSSLHRARHMQRSTSAIHAPSVHFLVISTYIHGRAFLSGWHSSSSKRQDAFAPSRFILYVYKHLSNELNVKRGRGAPLHQLNHGTRYHLLHWESYLVSVLHTLVHFSFWLSLHLS